MEPAPRTGAGITVVNAPVAAQASWSPYGGSVNQILPSGCGTTSLGGQCPWETVITMQHIHCRVDKPVGKPVITPMCGPRFLCIGHIAAKLGNQNVRDFSILKQIAPRSKISLAAQSGDDLDLDEYIAVRGQWMISPNGRATVPSSPSMLPQLLRGSNWG